MAEPPVMFKRSKTKRSQRTRGDLGSDADATTDTVAETGEESPITLAAKLKKRAKPKTRLSFGADEEEGDGEVFQVKKSNLSKKIALSKQSLSKVIPSSYELAPPASSAGTPTYSAAYLSELKAATPSARPKLPEDGSMSYDADVSLDADSLNQSTLSQIVDLTVDGEQETAIPSSSSIQVAKQKRERLRASGGNGEDYISLSLTKREDYSQGPHPDSRLVREEDELGEGDDEFAEYTSAQERIALGKKSRKAEARKRRDEMSEMIIDAEEQDEETMEWEQEQLRRGGHLADVASEEIPKATYKPAPIPSATPIPTLGPAIARLTQSLTALTTSHAEHTTSMVSLGEEQSQLESREKEMREMIAKAEEKRSWFAAFREWVESVATFLDEKFPLLEKIEDEQLSLLQERYDMISQRRQADDEDDLSLFLGALPVPDKPREEEVDELGRVVPKANPAAARRDRFSARNARRIHRRARGVTSQEGEGYSTDSSLPPSDASDYDLAIQKLLTRAKEILSDVYAKDFQDPQMGLGKWFNDWRERFGDSYTGAWGGLGMVGAWEFWTRLEIIGWDPIKTNRPLDAFAWYISLHNYSRPLDVDEETTLGPDGDLVSAMISTAVIPRVCKIVEKGGFDPYSVKDVRRLIDLSEEVEISVPKDNLKFEMILKSVFLVLQMAVKSSESTVAKYLALNQPRFDPEAIPARRRILTREYKLLNNILRWRKYAGDKYGIGALATLLVNDSMLPIAESGWEVGGEECIRKAVSILPPELVPSALKAKLRAK